MLVALPLDGRGDLSQRGLVGGRVEFAGQVHERLVQRVPVQGRDFSKAQFLIERPCLKKFPIISQERELTNTYSPELVQNQPYDSLPGPPWYPTPGQPGHKVTDRESKEEPPDLSSLHSS